MFWSYKKCQKIGDGRALSQVSRKNLLAQTILDKISRTKWSNPVKVDRKKKGLVCVFECFLTAIGKV